MSSFISANFAAVVLAAGSSSRLGQPKALLRWQGETLLTRALQLAQIGKPSACLLAIGHNADSLWRTWQQDVSNRLLSQHIQRLDVEDWQLGMGASLQAAVRAVNDRAEINGLLVLLVDQYRIEPAFIGALVQRWRAQPDFAACACYHDVQNEVPATQNVLGAPAILPRSWFNEILRLPAADVGARELLRSRNDVNVLAISAPGDVDLRGDLGGLRTF
jgi:molybdenum cofactor cytidylyltransferase